MRALLTDALALGYLPADRIHRVPSTLGWTAPNHPDDARGDVQPAPGPSLPSDAAGLATD
jgi:hypothetical protein